MEHRELMEQILSKIEQSDKIILCRHIRPDGDAVGSTLGLRAVLKNAYPEKEILVINEDYADYTAFIGEEDSQREDAFYSDALILALDTGTIDRLSNKKAALGKTIIKIDHHIDDKPYGDLSLVEEHRCSTCELITAFCLAFPEKLTITKEAARALYIGLVTDSGRFRYRETSGETLRLAAALLDTGIDTDTIFANLYLEEFEYIKSKGDIYRHLKQTENGVTYLYLSRRLQKKLGLDSEHASACVSMMDGIRSSLIWLAFIETGDKSIRVRLRSRFAEVQELATHYHGGGHACASGATVYSRKEAKKLIADADALLLDYKKNHGGWL